MCTAGKDLSVKVNLKYITSASSYFSCKGKEMKWRVTEKKKKKKEEEEEEEKKKKKKEGE